MEFPRWYQFIISHWFMILRCPNHNGSQQITIPRMISFIVCCIYTNYTIFNLHSSLHLCGEDYSARVLPRSTTTPHSGVRRRGPQGVRTPVTPQQKATRRAGRPTWWTYDGTVSGSSPLRASWSYCWSPCSSSSRASISSSKKGHTNCDRPCLVSTHFFWSICRVVLVCVSLWSWGGWVGGCGEVLKVGKSSIFFSNLSIEFHWHELW